MTEQWYRGIVEGKQMTKALASPEAVLKAGIELYANGGIDERELEMAKDWVRENHKLSNSGMYHTAIDCIDWGSLVMAQIGHMAANEGLNKLTLQYKAGLPATELSETYAQWYRMSRFTQNFIDRWLTGLVRTQRHTKSEAYIGNEGHTRGESYTTSETHADLRAWLNRRILNAELALQLREGKIETDETGIVPDMTWEEWPYVVFEFYPGDVQSRVLRTFTALGVIYWGER